MDRRLRRRELRRAALAVSDRSVSFAVVRWARQRGPPPTGAREAVWFRPGERQGRWRLALRGGDAHDPTPPEPPRSSRRPGAPSRKRSRRTPENPIPTAAGDRRELLRPPPAPAARQEKQRSAASGRELVSTQAAATAAAEDVVQLEAAYQQAFTAIETLVAAIERVHQLRGQQRAWEQANKLGGAGKPPEPWHVRAARDDELRQLHKRFTHALNSSW